MKKIKKFDGAHEKPIELLFDDFIIDINYFDDVSLKRTIHFFTKYKDTNNYLSILAGSLFVADNDDNSVLYFQKKTTIGFILVSGYYDIFMKFLNKIDKTIVDYDNLDENIPNIWTTELPTSELYYIVTNSVKKFIDENIDVSNIIGIYKEYFCFNYKMIRTKDVTDINCEEKNFPIKGVSKKQKQRLTKEQQEEIINEQIEKQKEEQKKYKQKEEKQIYEELIIKLSYFIYFCFQIKNKSAIKFIINHYILNVLKSDRATEYNISLVLGNRSYSNTEISLYNSFIDIDINNSFRTLKYLYQYNYNKKQFSTCGETTLLNILNYCLINDDGTFNTDKILNENVIKFYETKTMSQISEKGGRTIMKEWLDIVSNLKLPGIYNHSGDIHNNVNNVACVLNNLVYNKEFCEIENSQQFIVDTIKYISNNPIDVKIDNSSEDSISMIIDNIYSLFFRPGHGEMNIIVKKSSNRKIKEIDLHDIDSDEFDIVYSLYKKILTSYDEDGNKMDYDEALSYIIIEYFMNHIDKKIVQIILSSVKKLYITTRNIEVFDNKELIINFLDKIRNVTLIDLGVYESDYEIINFIIENIPKYLTKVKFFYIYIDELNYDFDLTPLSRLTNLETIDSYNIIFPYINAPNLKSFTYDGDYSENMDFIKNYKKLEKISLKIEDNFDMNNLSELVNLKDIALFFRVNKDNNLFDFKIFENLINLSNLSIICFKEPAVVKMKNTDILKKINLKTIYLSGFEISSYDLDIMFNLIGVENIRFADNNNITQTNILVIKNININKNLLDSLDKNKINYTKNSNEHEILMIYDKEVILNFYVHKMTKMKKIFDIFTEQYGTGYKFYINNKKIKESDSIEMLGIEDYEVVIQILDEDAESPKQSSPKKSSRTSRTSSRKSPKTSRTSSRPSSRKSPKTSRPSSRTSSRPSSRKSPKTSRTS